MSPPRMSTGATNGTTIRISPSRQELRRIDPSLSFQVVAPGFRFFDVIVTTDPNLFDPANAHLRTAKNFRSSRQDFQGAPIEVETGFYLLPRAFLRDVISIEPRPSRLYFVAAAYADASGPAGQYSVPPGQMVTNAPSILLSADLNTQTLSKVLGMAVERLGAVNAAGRVLAAATMPADSHLPAEIGGLPLIHRAPVPMPVPVPIPVPRVPAAAQPVPVETDTRTRPDLTHTTPAQDITLGNTTQGNTGPREEFVDEDYLHADKAPAPSGGFRDLDATSFGTQNNVFDYDDGFDDPAPAQQPKAASSDHPAVRHLPIPPLDPAPEPEPEPMVERPGSPRPALRPTSPAPSQAGPVGSSEALVDRIIAAGAGGRYDAISLDGGYRGRFGPSNPYYQRAHDGLALGPHQAGQDQGELGALLSLMQATDAAGFDRVFGADAAALLATATAPGPSALAGAEPRSARVQPVAGADLWESPWLERFRAAAAHPPFQGAMRAHIVSQRMEPILGIAQALGLESERGIAMMTALAIHQGVPGATALARRAVNPIDAPARLAAALDALGHVELASFRRAAGLAEGDTVDAATHFALIAALRALGDASPVQVPDAEAVMDALVTTAGPGTVGDALLKLRVSDAFASAQGE